MVGTNLKKDFRADIRTKRAAMGHAVSFDKSRRIAERLFASPAFAEAKTLHIYLATATEVQTDAIIENALSLGKRVTVPVISKDRLRLFEVQDISPERFCIGPFGIREPVVTPHGEIAKEAVNLWILPGVAYDLKGRRLGRGGGYYDRLFTAANDTFGALRMALAFELQIFDSIPFDSTDCRVDQILTEERVISCEGENNRW